MKEREKMKIVDINTLKGSDRHGSCTECEKDFAEDKRNEKKSFSERIRSIPFSYVTNVTTIFCKK